MITKEGREKYIRWFSELGKGDVHIAGGKGANLGEMYNSGMPVPPGFVITTQAYSLFLEKTGLREKIIELLKDLDEEDTLRLSEIAGKIRDMIKAEEIPNEVKQEIIESYENLSIDKKALEKASKDAMAILSKGFEMAFVAVRSSATAEDTEATSFAGQNETFLNIKGKTNVLKSVKACWASLFTDRSVYYRIKNNLIDKEVLICVIVQQMVNSDKSGVIFSKDPINENENIVIEAVFGLGEGIVSGKIKPDYYVVSRDMKILEKQIADKKIAIIRNSSGEIETVNLTSERSNSQVLSDYEIKKTADYAIQLEEHYNKPQDIEFAIDSGRLYIVQTRPITTLGKEKKQDILDEDKGEEILSGMPASPGVASGIVRIIRNLNDLSKIVKGDILVTKMTNPDMVVSMQKSAAIVTDEGGLTCHAAIISREMGIPAVVGTQQATDKLKDGMEITVDGSHGKVYSGKSAIKFAKIEIKQAVETQTKIKVMVDLPDFADRAAETRIKEVGLTRIEGIIAEAGKHPYLFLKENKLKEYEDIIYDGVNRIAKYFDRLWVRTSDIRSDEYMNLQGAPQEKEANPMLGMHGIRDSLIHKDILKAELRALKKIAEKKIIGILIPQIISVDEVQQIKKILEEIGFYDVELGVMVETPAAVEIIEDLCSEGIDFISFGTNDLTQYTLAIDRGNEDVQYLFDEMNPAVLNQLSHVIKICKIYNVETSICGQAGSKKEMVEFLVKLGIDSISVNADKAEEISKFVAELEEKGLRGSELEAEVDKDEKIVEEEKEAIEQEEIQEDFEIDDGKGILGDKRGKVSVSGQEEEKDEETVEEAKKDEKAEEFPDIEIGFDVFSEVGKKVIEKVKEIGEKIGDKVEEVIEKDKKQEKKHKKWRKAYDIKCSDCGSYAQVPFKPKEGLPVYCKKCWLKKNQEKLDNVEKEKNDTIEQNDENIEDIELTEREAEELREENEEEQEERGREGDIEEQFYVEHADDIIEDKKGLDIY